MLWISPLGTMNFKFKKLVVEKLPFRQVMSGTLHQKTPFKFYSNTKNWPGGEGFTQRLVTNKWHHLSGVAQVVHVSETSLFRYLCHERGTTVTLDTRYQAMSIFALLIAKLGSDAKGYKTRSFRIGATTNAWDQGKSEDQIAAGAGWSQSVYINTLDATPVTRFFVTVGCISLIIFLFFLFIIGNLYIYQYQCRWPKKIWILQRSLLIKHAFLHAKSYFLADDRIVVTPKLVTIGHGCDMLDLLLPQLPGYVWH